MPDNYVYQDGELYHYGVLGMKWGVRKAARKSEKNAKLLKKALKKDKKQAVLTKRSEKQHAKKDLGRANRKAVKAAVYRKRAAKKQLKALKEPDEYKRLKLERKAAKLKYKSSKKLIKGNRLSKTTGYGRKAMRLSVRSDRVARSAAKARYKIAKNEAYIALMNKRMSSLSPEKLRKVQTSYFGKDGLISEATTNTINRVNSLIEKMSRR